MKNFMSLQRALATRNFRPELVTLPGGIILPDRPQPPPAAPRSAPLTVIGNTPAGGRHPPNSLDAGPQ